MSPRLSKTGLYAGSMTEVTRILEQIEKGHTAAAAELLPLVYAELRKLAFMRKFSSHHQDSWTDLFAVQAMCL
jgi:ECF sigma factor